jgi:Na+/H+-dicarboxylate symporter
MRKEQRSLVWAVVIAAVLGVGVGWFARKWYQPSPEQRAHETADEIRDKVRRFTR